MSGITMKLLNGKYGVCRLEKSDVIPEWAQKGDIFSISRTPDELSIVCMVENIPNPIKCEKDWKILRVEGPLDFSLVGVLASISTILAQSGVSIFALSTYDTDYILVKEKDVNDAMRALAEEGYNMIAD